MSHSMLRADNSLALAWVLLGIGMTVFVVVLMRFSDHFEWSRPLSEMPIAELVAGSVLCGLFFLALRWLVPAADRTAGKRLTVLSLIFAMGLFWRVVLLWSTPVLEDDFYRYLWDGAVVSGGMNPYAFAPGRIAALDAPLVLQHLAIEAGGVFERINHPELKTIYPPVAQFWFGVSHFIEPWNLLAWRLVGLAGECTTFALLVSLLIGCDRSPIWSVLYWWNPIVIKELANSAHLESILLPLVLLALWLSMKRRYVAAAAALAFAVGTKIWPVILLPLVLRPLVAEPRRLVMAIAVFSVLVVVWAIPPLAGGIDTTSGFVQFARYWQSNSALYQGLMIAVGQAAEIPILPLETVGIFIRAGLAAVVVAAAIALSWHRSKNELETVRRAMVVVGVLFLLSPVQFPWYATWVLVLFPFLPALSMYVATLTLPLYYLSFHFAATGQHEQFGHLIVWMIWVPIWCALIYDLRLLSHARQVQMRDA